MLVSPVKIRIGEFNQPVLGDRIWGTYNTFSKVGGQHGIDVYVLRHDENRPGGFPGGNQRLGTDRLGVTSLPV